MYTHDGTIERTTIPCKSLTIFEDDAEDIVELLHEQYDMLIAQFKLAAEHHDDRLLNRLGQLIEIYINPGMLEFAYMPVLHFYKNEALRRELFKYAADDERERLMGDFRTSIDTTMYLSELNNSPYCSGTLMPIDKISF